MYQKQICTQLIDYLNIIDLTYLAYKQIHPFSTNQKEIILFLNTH